MKKENRRSKAFLRPLFVLILSLALLAPVLDAKERRGAHLVITKRDGKVLQGELLAVKGENLILMDGSMSEGIAENISDILTIKVVKKSKFLKGLGIGFLIGAGSGAIIGVAFFTEGNIGIGPRATPAIRAGCGVILGGAIGALIGGVAGGIAGTDRNITVDSKNPQETARVLIRLRRLARDRGGLKHRT